MKMSVFCGLIRCSDQEDQLNSVCVAGRRQHSLLRGQCGETLRSVPV